MARPVKMKIGERFGMLTVIERVESAIAGQTKWKCLCDCGNTKDTYATHLRRGSVKTCGCASRRLQAEAMRKPDAVPYGPEFHSWATRREQQNNRSATRFVSFNGETLPLTDWARRVGLRQNVLWNRLYLYKWPVAEALGFKTRA